MTQSSSLIEENVMDKLCNAINQFITDTYRNSIGGHIENIIDEMIKIMLYNDLYTNNKYPSTEGYYKWLDKMNDYKIVDPLWSGPYLRKTRPMVSGEIEAGISLILGE